MFSAIYRYNITKTGEYFKELSLSFLEMETELKNSYWFVFIDVFVSADGRKITHVWATLQFLSQYSRL